MSENLQNRMLLRLFFSEGWQPIVRMDQFPTLCKLVRVKFQSETNLID